MTYKLIQAPKKIIHAVELPVPFTFKEWTARMFGHDVPRRTYMTPGKSEILNCFIWSDQVMELNVKIRNLTVDSYFLSGVIPLKHDPYTDTYECSVDWFNIIPKENVLALT